MQNGKIKLLSLVLCALMLFGAVPMTIFATGEENDMSVTNLKVNNLTEPLGIDTTPTFRWVNRMPGYARAQSAYQIIVATTAEKAAAHDGDVWDSGKVESNLNYDILYGGDALASCTEYYFAVKVWDESGEAVWSDVSSFGTGFFDAAEWSAKWIGAADGDSVPCDIDLSGANWIWFKDGAATTGAGTEYFRKWFTVDESKEVDEVLLSTTMDDYGYLFVNCSTVLRVENVKDAWKTGKAVNITPFVERGDNIFGARVVNTASSAGFIAKIEVRYTDGTVDTTVTDTSWKVSGTATSTSGWERPGYDDSSWSTPDMTIAYGGGPWKTNVVMPATMQVNVGAGAPMLRKTFDITKEVKDAKLYISGLGLYDLYVNGDLPDDTVLSPAHTQYDDTVHYRAYDVTKMLTTGKNALAAELGNYFYNCDFYTYMNWNTATFRDDPKLLLELHVTYTDGTSEVIATDESWKTYEYGPTTYNNVYKGEHYDARRAVEGWTVPDFDDSAWKNAVSAAAPTGDLIFENMEPIRRLATFTPEVCSKGDGTYIIKNPVMTTGWAKIALKAPRGTELTITYGEKLDGMGFVVRTRYGYPLQIDKFITSGGEDVYEPKYSYKGYEYIQIDNYPGTLTADDVECYLIANDITDISTFETGDSRINYMQEMMLRTVMNNLQSKLTDTPVYEKNGWTGDVNFALESFNFNYDLSNILPKILRDMGDTTNAKGVVNQIAPSASNGGSSIPIWSSIFISGYYENYRTNGVFSAIEENYDLIRLQTLDYINTIKANGWVWTTGSYADWVSPNPSGAYLSGTTTHAPEGAGIIGSAFVYRTLSQMAEIADKLGKTQDAAEYRAAMANIYTAFNTKFYDAEKGYYDTGYWNEQYDAGRTKYRQASNIVPLMFGLCPDEYKESVAASIVNDIKAKDDHLDVGAVGTKYILPMLSKYGYSDLAMTLVQQDTYPSWGYWINLGANTCWETYESNARSRNHFFLGTYTDWFYKNLAGVRDYANGFETVVLKPEIHPEVGYVNYSLDTVRGTLKSFWKFTEDNKLVWNVTVPVGTTASVYLPAAADVSAYPCITQNGAYLTVPSGDYTFVMDGAAFAVDKSLLTKAVAGAGALDAGEYTKTSQTALAAALSAANAALADENATAYAVCAAKSALEDAVDALDKDTAKAKLATLVERGESIDGGTLPNAISSALSGVIAAAKGAHEDDLADASAALETALAAVSAYGKGNLALGKTVIASSSVESAAWGAAKLTDGDLNNFRGASEVCGWTSNENTQFNHTEYVTVDLGATYKIDRVEVMPAGAAKGNKCVAFPRDFKILVSTDGETWTAVYGAENYPVPTTEMLVFDFAAADARYVRFEGTSIRIKTTDGNRYRMQLAELEVYNTSLAYSDIDLDGDVDLLDGFKLLKMVLDKDGGVNLRDVIRLLKEIAK
ncbi:MAG: family 78 glycoside hydrolase catalytic domain [Clostridia bacterium]|nr:family 78 glycoside hydrolase catalytic domain [Clostridia bacterium]